MRRMQRKQLQKTIDRMARLIVRRFDPDRIILFGSHARGQAGPDSDVDLLVIMPTWNQHSQRSSQCVGLIFRRRTISSSSLRCCPQGKNHDSTLWSIGDLQRTRLERGTQARESSR